MVRDPLSATESGDPTGERRAVAQVDDFDHAVSGDPADPADVSTLLARRTVLGSRAALIDEIDEADDQAAGRVTRIVRYDALEPVTRRLVGALRAAGAAPGDRVGVVLANSVDAALVFLAVLRARMVWVGISPMLTDHERAELLAHCGATVVVDETWRAVIAHALAGPPGERSTRDDTEGDGRGRDTADRLAVISYTSGTSGRPKGVMHSEAGVMLAATAAARRGEGRGVIGMALPMSSVNMQILGPLTAIAAGGTCVCLGRQSSRDLASAVARFRIDSMPLAAPTVVDWIADGTLRAQLHGLRQPVIGGSGAPEAVFAAYAARFGHRLTLGYGLTEAPTSVTREPPGSVRRNGSSGCALGHLCVEIRDRSGRAVPPGVLGEIWVGPAASGPWAGRYRPMLGYWDDAAATAAALRDGWLRTGDLGALDGDGYLVVEGRADDVIVRGGANVSPAEVERVLRGVPGVIDAAVVGVPDQRLGTVPVALIVAATDGGSAHDPDAALRDACAAQLAGYKRPVRFVRVAAIPRTTGGKLRRAELLALIDAATDPGAR